MVGRFHRACGHLQQKEFSRVHVGKTPPNIQQTTGGKKKMGKNKRMEFSEGSRQNTTLHVSTWDGKNRQRVTTAVGLLIAPHLRREPLLQVHRTEPALLLGSFVHSHFLRNLVQETTRRNATRSLAGERRERERATARHAGGGGVLGGKRTGSNKEQQC